MGARNITLLYLNQTEFAYESHFPKGNESFLTSLADPPPRNFQASQKTTKSRKLQSLSPSWTCLSCSYRGQCPSQSGSIKGSKLLFQASLSPKAGQLVFNFPSSCMPPKRPVAIVLGPSWEQDAGPCHPSKVEVKKSVILDLAKLPMTSVNLLSSLSSPSNGLSLPNKSLNGTQCSRSLATCVLFQEL